MGCDERVHALLSTGDVRGAATEAIAGVGPDALRFLRAVLRNETDVEDAFSQFAENVWNGVASFRGRSSVRTWALHIAWNVASNLKAEAWRRRGRRLATTEASALAAEVRESSLRRHEHQRWAMEDLRRSLSAEDQSLLSLRLDHGLSWDDAAEVLSSAGKRVRPATLMKRYERLTARLAREARTRGLVY
jgi:RNA polymerase sigma-70 factor, ECF subfamily